MSLKPEQSSSSNAFYEVASYYCPQVPLKTCNQTIEGTGEVIMVSSGPSDIAEYTNAIKKASLNSPQCPIHLIAMVPLLTKMDELPPSSTEFNSQ